MAIGLVGRKVGMTRVFTAAGETVPVTVIEVLPNRVTQVKTSEKDGYRAVQVAYGSKRPQLLTKAVAGHYAKANAAPGKALVEFRLEDPAVPIKLLHKMSRENGNAIDRFSVLCPPHLVEQLEIAHDVVDCHVGGLSKASRGEGCAAFSEYEDLPRQSKRTRLLRHPA